jgi:hypothetical protein
MPGVATTQYQSNFGTGGAWTLTTTTGANVITVGRAQLGFGATVFQSDPDLNYQINPTAAYADYWNNGVYPLSFMGYFGTALGYIRLDIDPGLGGSYPWTVFPEYQGRMVNLSLYSDQSDGSYPLKFHPTTEFDESSITWNNKPALGSSLGSFPCTGSSWRYDWEVSIPYNRYMEFDIGTDVPTGTQVYVCGCWWYNVHGMYLTPSFNLYAPKLVQNSSCVLMQSNTTELLTMTSPEVSVLVPENQNGIVTVNYHTTSSHNVNLTLWNATGPLMTQPIIPEGNTQQAGVAIFDIPTLTTITRFSFNGTMDDLTYFQCDSLSVESYPCEVDQPAPNVAYNIIPKDEQSFALDLTLTNDSVINNDPEHYIHSITFSFATLSIGTVSIPEIILNCAIDEVPQLSFNLTDFGVPRLDMGPFNFTATIEYVSGIYCGPQTYLTKTFTFQYLFTTESNESTDGALHVAPPATSINGYPLEIIVPLFIIGIAYFARKRKSAFPLSK